MRPFTETNLRAMCKNHHLHLEGKLQFARPQFLLHVLYVWCILFVFMDIQRLYILYGYNVICIELCILHLLLDMYVQVFFIS